MYKLLIVDDEKSVRDRLAGIRWDEFEISSVDFAEHGLIALQKIYKEQPDFILSDIHMPVMNGIEMIKKVHERFPWIGVVVLTGYDDFNYIRECMRSAVTDYILKPINEDELRTAFRKLLEAKKDEDAEKVRYETEHFKKQEIIRGLRRRFLKHYFTEHMTEDEIEESSAYAELNLDGDRFSTMIFRLDLNGEDPKEHYGDEMPLITFALDNIVSEYLEENENVCGRVNSQTGDVWILISKELSAEEAEKLAEDIKETIYSVAQMLETTVSAAMGIYVADKTNILASLHSAERLLAAPHERDAFLVSQEAESDERNAEKPEPEKPDEIGDTNSMKLVTRSALDFIDKNFTRTITLDDVADHVYLSPTYVSYLFRSEVKMNFINYLTSKRMEKAKELLKNPRLKIYEISTAVGYENSRYFSSIFKKYTGQTPIDYRSSLGLTE